MWRIGAKGRKEKWVKMGPQKARGKAEVPRMETVNGVERYLGSSGNHVD